VNGTEYINIALTGSVTINAPSSGNPLVVNQRSGGTTGVLVSAPSGTQSSLRLLQASNGDYIIYVPASSTDLRIYDSSAATDRVILKSTGLFRWLAYGAGTLTTDGSGNITAVSDERVKVKIRPFRTGLDAVLGLKPILHGYSKKSGLDRSRFDYAGFSAQNVRDVIPEAVGQGADGYLTLSDRPILAALVNAIKELQAEVAALRRPNV
jgi:hypothetical protein